MRKSLFVVSGFLVSMFVISLCVSAVASAQGKNVPNGKPFQELQDQINNIQLTPGPQGAQGPAGLQGPQGVAGADGADGAPGTEGPQGPAGLQGPQGVAGADGVDGAPGAEGPQGPAGLQGPQGVAGADGVDGAPGAEGPQGPAGSQGPQGVAGADGNDGDSVWTADADGFNVVVTGSAQVGDNKADCNDSLAGAIRFNAATKNFEGCNGRRWEAITQPSLFECGDMVEDKYNPGIKYKSVQIGNQCWLAQDLITDVQGAVFVDDNADYTLLKHSFYTAYQAMEDNKIDRAIEGAQGICPNQWHVPTGYEVSALINTDNAYSQFVGLDTEMKLTLIGKYNHNQSKVIYEGSKGLWLTSTVIDGSIYVLSVGLTPDRPEFALRSDKVGDADDTYAFHNHMAVRCIKD